MTAKPRIHIQPDLFWEDEHRTPNEIEAANYFEVTKLKDLPSPSLNWKFQTQQAKELGVNSSFRGSLDYARRLGYKFDYANVMNWLPYFRKDCVSANGTFTDLADAQEQLRRFYNRLFIRPVSPFKEFSGDVFTEEKINKEVAWLKQGKNIQPYELICLTAAPSAVLAEWRCVFVNNQFVTASQYMTNGELDVSHVYPAGAMEFAKKLAATDYFANVFDFVIDVGLTTEGYKLVEINGFETASFYAADLAKIYSAWAQSLSK